MTVTGSYTQDFNSLSQSGSSNNFTNNNTISSWYIQREDGNANPNSYLLQIMEEAVVEDSIVMGRMEVLREH
ncbi:hypothetical protein H9X57_15245 [Flavobacterium piscinae]|uniref:hypothetical protein n=1 Tax=Flavobacterium piscinae TaxID=2506424 RepID=UPI0019B3C6A9|nr:hypothetical protein [Flavobacterium piscinae]MBC8884227.1 hypothetical protein [Flavobacterium piscinae]